MGQHKHTPAAAPWRWTDEYRNQKGESTMSLVAADGYGILSCDGLGNAPQGLGDDANARLIAAAPDMLQALIDADANLANHGLPVEGPTRSEIRAAIAKATGAA